MSNLWAQAGPELRSAVTSLLLAVVASLLQWIWTRTRWLPGLQKGSPNWWKGLAAALLIGVAAVVGWKWQGVHWQGFAAAVVGALAGSQAGYTAVCKPMERRLTP